MTPLLNREDARRFDASTIAGGVPGIILMENAGRGAADLLCERFAGRLSAPLVLGGTGQNGGDAWVVARRLKTMGLRPSVFLVGDRARVTGDAAVNLSALESLGVQVTPVGPALEVVSDALTHATVCIDGIFGTGLDRPIEGWRRQLVETTNSRGVPCFALDLPSGVDANTGQILGVALEAELTATFAAHKPGLWQAPGRSLAGEVALIDIGVPPPLSREGLIEPSDVARWIAPRPIDAHKGTAGHVLVVAGSPGTSGAALLVGRGALRSGAGRCTVATRTDLAGAVVELMAIRLGEPLAEHAERLAAGKQTAVVGPGLGVDEAGLALCRTLAETLPIPTVLDADALTALAGTDLKRLCGTSDRVLTPHPGEAARLLGRSTAEIQADRRGAAHELSRRSGHVVALKGLGTVVAAPDGRLGLCARGTPALAVAGTGDVLAGVIGALLVEAAPFEAACAGVFLHATAGELGAIGDRGLLASEVADHLPRALDGVRQDA